MRRLLLILLLLTLLLACVPTPEEEFVVNKGDQNAMIESSRSEETVEMSDLRSVYHIPDRMTGSCSSADGVINVTIDAVIIVPDGPLPIVHVYAAEFEQQIVTALWNELVGDAVLYDQWENEETKADIERDLKQYNEQLSQIQSGELDENDAMYSVDELTEMIADLQTRYASAPDGHEKVIETGVLHKQYFPLGDNKRAAFRMGISAHTEGEPWIQFKVENDTDNTEMLIHYESDGWSGIDARRSARFYYYRNSDRSNCFDAAWCCDCATLIPIKPDDPIPDAASGSLSMTPSDACAEVERFLEAVGLSDTFTISRAVVSGDSMQPDTPSTEYGYSFELVRKVGNTTCNRSLLSTGASKVNEDEFAPTWSYEQFMIGLDNEGIFCVNWKAPFTLGDTINENAKLKDFSEIQAIAERMLPMMEVENFQPEYSKKAYRTVDRIELGLWRIAEQNELGKGMLVPAYCFYGTDSFTRTVKDAYHDFSETSYRSRIVLILNAIDGSVIDPAKGY